MILIVDMTDNELHFMEFVKPIIRIIGNGVYGVINYKKINKKDFSNKIKKCDSIIISGSALGDSDYDVSDFLWIKECNKPILGICSGMQVICELFRGKLYKCREIGMTKVRTVRKNKLFSGEFSAYSLHNYATQIPFELDILAESDECVQAVKHKEKDVYGVMFHPEVRNEEMIKRFISSAV